jgi:hypothetical protein
VKRSEIIPQYVDVFQAPIHEPEFDRAAFHPGRRKWLIGTDAGENNEFMENILLRRTAKTVEVMRWDVQLNVVPPRRVLVQQIRHHTIHGRIAVGWTKKAYSQRKSSRTFQPFGEKLRCITVPPIY